MNHVRKARPTLISDHGRSTSKNHVRKACLALTSDHGRNTSKTHVRKAQYSHLTSYCQKGFALTSNLIFSKRICTCIQTHLVRKDLHLHLTSSLLERLYTYIQPHLVRKVLHLHLTSSCYKGSTLTSNLILLERICIYI